jgi:hypothetical protein
MRLMERLPHQPKKLSSTRLCDLEEGRISNLSEGICLRISGEVLAGAGPRGRLRKPRSDRGRPTGAGPGWAGVRGMVNHASHHNERDWG